MSATPFLAPGATAVFRSGCEVECWAQNMGLVGFHGGSLPGGPRLYNTVRSDGLWDLCREAFGSLTGALPQGVHKGGGGNVSPAGEVLVTVASSRAQNAIPGRGAGNDVWLLDLEVPANTRRVLHLFGPSDDVLARYWPCGRVGTDGRFDEFVVAEVVKVWLFDGDPINEPMGDALIGRYRMDGSMLARYGASWRPGFCEPYPYSRDGKRFFFTGDAQGKRWLDSRIQSIDLASGAVTPLMPGSSGYQEFALELGDGAIAFGWATSSWGLEVWVLLPDGEAYRLTEFSPVTGSVRRQCTQLVADPDDPLVVWVSVQEFDASHLNLYRLKRPR